MFETPRVQEQTKTLVCLDSYDNGVPVGRIYGPHIDGMQFNSMSQFLIKMEELLDNTDVPRSFSAKESSDAAVLPMQFHRGAQATFAVQVLFRQHTSWQGIITWLEEHMEQRFRSVMELILLMDSALRYSKGAATPT